MALQLFKTLWGHEGSFELACQQAVAAGFAGIEGPAPEDPREQQAWRDLLDHYRLDYIAEITTGGSYVPDRSASLQQHLDTLDSKLQHSLALNPLFVTCLGGCDAWDKSESLQFFEAALLRASAVDTVISFETHRGRSFFNPWLTEAVCREMPGLKLTCDFSHWCVVCERLFDETLESLAHVFAQAFHIHARVGHAQGPQVSDPASAMYAEELQQHERWWQKIWHKKILAGESITMTPEFGPDGYQMVNPASGKAVGDLWQMNCWMAKRQQQQYEIFRGEQA